MVIVNLVISSAGYLVIDDEMTQSRDDQMTK